jgi:predicted lipoprotein with Yx(FWY)xxD motif
MRHLILFIAFYFLIETSYGLRQRRPNTRPSPRRPSTRPSTPARPTTSNQPQPNLKGINIIEGVNSDYPKYLANEEGMSLYMDSESPIGFASCYGECAKLFIPAMVRMNDSIKLNDNLEEAKVGMLTREDGSVQIAYNNYGLFYFKNDTEAGDVKGQGYNNTFFLLDEKGIPYKSGRNASEAHNETVRAEEPSTTTSTSRGSSQSLQVPGYASMLLMPDNYIIYFTLSEKTSNQSNNNPVTSLDKTVKDLKKIVSRAGSSDLTFLSKEMHSKNDIYEMIYNYFTTSSDEAMIEKLSKGVEALNSLNKTVNMTIGNTLSNKSFKDVRKVLFQLAMKNSFDTAYDMVGNLNYTINMQKPIHSVRIDPESILKFHQTYFGDTASKQVLLNRTSNNVVAMKVMVDYNIKNK